MTHNPYFYIAVMALVSYTTRVLPLTLIRKPIKNQFIQSFLYSVPYITLSVMTFPAIIEATQSPVAGASICRLLYGCIDPGINSCIEMFFCPFPCFSPFFLVIPIFS